MPELNDTSLAESVVILMRYAVIKEIHLNTEVQKPSLADVLEFQGPRMDCAEESTPHPEARVYSSTFEGGEVMQQFEVEEPVDLQTTGVQRDMLIPVRAEGEYSVPTNPWPRDSEREERDTTGVKKRKPVYRRRGPSNRWDQYGESSSAASSEAHITSEQVSMESNWAHGHHLSQPAEVRGQLSHIDFRRPIQVMANGPDGLAISDSRSLTSEVVVPPDGIPLPAASAPGTKYHQNGKDSSGLHRLEGPWEVLNMTQIKNGRCEA